MPTEKCGSEGRFIFHVFCPDHGCGPFVVKGFTTFLWNSSGTCVCVCVCVFYMPFPTFQGSRTLILILIRSNNLAAFFNFTEFRFLFSLTSCGCSDTMSTVGARFS